MGFLRGPSSIHNHKLTFYVSSCSYLFWFDTLKQTFKKELFVWRTKYRWQFSIGTFFRNFKKHLKFHAKIFLDLNNFWTKMAACRSVYFTDDIFKVGRCCCTASCITNSGGASLPDFRARGPQKSHR